MLQETMSASAILENIKSVKANSNSLKDQIQAVACAILIRTALHGDANGAIELIDAVGKGVRYGALVSFMEAGGLSFYTDKKKVKRVSVKNKPSEDHISELILLDWTSFKHEDTQTEEEKLRKRFTSAMKLISDNPEMAAEFGLFLEQVNNAA